VTQVDRLPALTAQSLVPTDPADAEAGSGDRVSHHWGEDTQTAEIGAPFVRREPERQFVGAE
jgi:hypothetical protein